VTQDIPKTDGREHHCFTCMVGELNGADLRFAAPGSGKSVKEMFLNFCQKGKNTQARQDW
jgi:hypothetical protein